MLVVQVDKLERENLYLTAELLDKGTDIGLWLDRLLVIAK